MSHIAKGFREPRGGPKKYGYLAVFNDGDMRRHVTNFPKSHCVRVTLAPSKRWQHAPIIQGAEVRCGMQLHESANGYRKYEWFPSEADAVREVKKALSLTQANWLGQRWGGEIHPLNQPFADDPYYSEVAIVAPKVVWAERETTQTLAELGDPRITLQTPESLEKAILSLTQGGAAR